MINPQDMLWSLGDYAKDYQSGMNPVPEFNTKLNESQQMLFDILSPEYDRNERVRSLLEPLVKSAKVTSLASGVITPPDGFHRVLGGRYSQGSKRYPIYYAKENEIIESDFIPQRKADLSKGIAYFTYMNGSLILTPNTVLEIDMVYLANPAPAKLVYNYSATPQSYVQLDTVNTNNLDWNNNASGLILSILLMKYGVIGRDQLKMELGNFGISIDPISR